MNDFIIRYWLEVLFTTIAGTLSFFIKRLYSRAKKEVEEQKRIKEGVLAILHDRLYQICSHYIQQGWISVDDMKNLEYVYNGYHRLEGNGTGTELFQRCQKLPIHPPKLMQREKFER